MINSNNGRLPERKFHHKWPPMIIIANNDDNGIIIIVIIINKKTKSANKMKINKCPKQLLQTA